MSPSQIDEAKRLAGTMPREAIAEALGVSLSNLKRSVKDVRFTYFNHLRNNPKMVREVCSYYEKHGKRKTQEKYPHLKIRSIVEKYKNFSPRQSRWKDHELIELAKFAGLVSFKKQAEFFNRPLANEGAIRSAWVKNLKTKSSFMHGLPIHKAKIFLNSGFPVIKRQALTRDRYSNEMVLFCDAKNYIADDCPEFIKGAITAMAEFQVLLFGADPRTEIENILESFND
jgi:hypothetical protein